MDRKKIKKSLQKIEKEVDDFHLHLQEFLPQLPEVIEAEYTHGPSEFGADFILTTQHKTTGLSYVGVVVKVGTITKTISHKVIEQIKECVAVSRPMGNGKRYGRLNEVWVITTGRFTNNAKIMIAENHHTGVHFIDGEQLAGLMAERKYSLNSELPTSVAICLTKQLNLADKLKNESVGHGLINADQIFIDQQVYKLDHRRQYAKHKRNQRQDQKQKPISIESALKQNTSLMIHGNPGSGKTRMLQRILSHYASDEQYESTQAIPIFTKCKEIQEKHEGKISNLIEKFREEHNLNDDTSSLYTVIIDGIDECGLTRDEKLKHIKEWRSSAFKGTEREGKIYRLIFASRDHFYDESIDNLPIYKIAPLSEKDVIHAIKKNLQKIDAVDRIIRDVQTSDIFRSLSENPLAVIILVNLLNASEGHHELPANLTELFLKYSEWTLGRSDPEVDETTKQKRYLAATKILSNIARYMVDNNISQMNQDEALFFFKDYLDNRNLSIDVQEMFKYITDRSDLLYVDDGVFQFRHRTISEFFYALSYSDKDIDDTGEAVFDIKWVNILYFHVGLQKDCSELISKISAIRPSHESGKIMKSINMSNILLAGYASPNDAIQKALEDIFMDTAKYLNDVINGRVAHSGFSTVSVMRTLSFFRIIMDNYYSRYFFRQAIEDSMIKIEELDTPDSIKATALFLLNLPYSRISEEKIFDSMIKNMGKNKIPLHIRLAIGHEADFLSDADSNLKNYVRAIKKSISKPDMKHRDTIEPLYHKQIGLLYNKKSSEKEKNK